MFNLYFHLFFQFFCIGLFSFGGGYATMPFLYDISEKFHWYSTSQLANMLALSSLTPGPVGVNMATFAGFTTSGIAGALIATTAVMLPSFIFVTIISKALDKYKTNEYVKSCVSALKPAGCGLLSAVGIKLILTSNLNLTGTILLIFLIILSFKKRFDPLFYLGLTACFGFILGSLNFIGV